MLPVTEAGKSPTRQGWGFFNWLASLNITSDQDSGRFIIMKQAVLSLFVAGLIFSTIALSSCTSKDRPGEHQGAGEKPVSMPGTGAPPDNSVVSETRVLSSIQNFGLSMQESQEQNHSPQGTVVFSELGRGAAYVEDVGDKQRVVHNGIPGILHSKISYLTISPDGQRVSYRCALVNKEQLVSDGVARQVYDNVRDMVYSPDSKHFAYVTQVGISGDIYLDDRVLASGPAFGRKFFSRDSSKFVYTIRPGGLGLSRMVVMDLKYGARSVKDFVDIPSAENMESDTVAIAIQDGSKQRVMDFNINAPEKTHLSNLYDKVQLISIGEDGKSIAFVAAKGNVRYLVLNGREERLPDDLAFNGPPVIRPDLKGAGIILSTLERYNRRDILHQAMFHDSSIEKKFYPKIKELVYNKQNSSAAYVVKEGEQWFVFLNGRKGPGFDMIVTPQFSPDGRWLIYRARAGGRRQVVVADATGRQHHRHAEAELVYPVVFTADGKSIAYGVKDGNQLIWKVEKLQ